MFNYIGGNKIKALVSHLKSVSYKNKKNNKKENHISKL